MAKPDLMNPKSLNAKAPDTFDVKFTTTKGPVVIRVTRAWAPRGADRFYNLVRGKFFDGAAFFRVIPGFMAQFGISPDPKVSAAWNSQNLQDALNGLQGLGVDGSRAVGVLSQALERQAYLMSSLDYFWISGWLTLLPLVLVWLTRRPRATTTAAAE